MLLTDLVAPNAIIPALRVNSKKQILQELTAKAAELSGQSERTILEILQQRTGFRIPGNHSNETLNFIVILKAVAKDAALQSFVT